VGPWHREREHPRLYGRVSIVSGDVPIEGIVRPKPFRWDDVLGSASRPEDAPSTLAWCVPGAEIVAGADRIEHALLVHARDASDEIELEHRIGVARRVLGDAIVAERAAIGRNVVATIPDRLRQRASKAQALLATREGRRRFAAGLRDPRALSGEQKAITLFVATAAMLAVLLVAHVAVTLVFPRSVSRWRAGLALFLYGYVNSLGVPTPWEVVIVAASLVLGVVPTFVVALASKVVAGYMVFFVGDAMNARLERKAATTPWFARFLRWSERFARRFGLFAIALFVGTPGLPDAVALYVFGALRMPLWRFILGVALGALVRDGIVLFGAARLLHIG
jgi:membrane protein YqaA with SNARE-associated domain